MHFLSNESAASQMVVWYVDAGNVLPLPKGEGRGEGKGDIPQQMPRPVHGSLLARKPADLS